MTDENKDWDGWETFPMQVNLLHAGEVEPFLNVRCDRFHLNMETGRITLWRLNNKKYELLLKIENYDAFSIDQLYEENNSIN